MVRFTPKLSVNEVETQLIAARACRGIARLVFYQIVEDGDAGTLVPLLETFEPEPVPVQLATPSPRIAPKVRAFLNYAVDALGRLDVVRESCIPKQRTQTRAASKRMRG